MSRSMTQIQMIHLCSYFSFFVRVLISVARLGNKLPIEPNEMLIDDKKKTVLVTDIKLGYIGSE